ncbi:MAG: hypothetical protein PVI23_02190 [Maricaulaceae bacterium]|jgi:hypothetical protein
MMNAKHVQQLDALANAGPKELLVAAAARRLRAPGGAALLSELQRHVAAYGLKDRRLPAAPAPTPQPPRQDPELDALAAEACAWFKAGARRSQLKSARARQSIAHGLDVLAARGALAADIAAFRAACAERPDCDPRWIDPNRRIGMMMRRRRPFSEIAREAEWLRRLAESAEAQAQAA